MDGYGDPRHSPPRILRVICFKKKKEKEQSIERKVSFKLYGVQSLDEVNSLLTGLVLIFIYEALEKVQYGGHILTAARQRTAGKELKNGQELNFRCDIRTKKVRWQ